MIGFRRGGSLRHVRLQSVLAVAAIAAAVALPVVLISVGGGVSSHELSEIQNAGYRIVNVDTTLVLNAPRIGPISGEMRERVAELLDIAPANVGIKAKTPEGLAADHVAQAHAVVLLERIEEPGELQTMSAVMESQRQLEDVVKDLVSQVHGVPVKAPFDTDDIT